MVIDSILILKNLPTISKNVEAAETLDLEGKNRYISICNEYLGNEFE